MSNLDKFLTKLGLKKITVYSSKGPSPTNYWQLSENNIICFTKGHIFSYKTEPKNPYTGYTSSSHCFRCGFDNWTDPWT